MKFAMRFVAARAGVCLVAVLVTVTAHGVGSGSVVAVWREHRVQFTYAGRTSQYSCQGLREKVRAMLLDLGVRRDLRMSSACAGTGRSAAGAATTHLGIHFFAPAVAGTGPSAARNDLHTAARFEAFAIRNDAFRNMDINDCELVEEFVRQILPRLATRGLKQDIACVAYQNGSRFLVQGEILRALSGDDAAGAVR